MCLRWKPHKSIANPHSFFVSARTKFVSTHVSEFTKSRLFIPKQSKTTIGFSFSFSRLHQTLFDTLHFQTTTILTLDHKINKKISWLLLLLNFRKQNNRRVLLLLLWVEFEPLVRLKQFSFLLRKFGPGGSYETILSNDSIVCPKAQPKFEKSFSSSHSQRSAASH